MPEPGPARCFAPARCCWAPLGGALLVGGCNPAVIPAAPLPSGADLAAAAWLAKEAAKQP